MEKLKKVIAKMKNDKTSIVEYSKCFINNSKINELLIKNEEFRKLKENINKNQENI